MARENATVGNGARSRAAIAFIALAAVIAMTAPAIGAQHAWADDATASIQISGATDGTYYAYKLLDGTFAEDDTEGDAMGDAYLRDDVRELLLSALEDYGYEIDVEGRSERAIANDVMDALVAVGEDDNAQAFANDLAGALAQAGIEPAATATASNGSVTLTGLDQGYYLVAQKETSDSAMTSALLVPLTVNGRSITAKVTTPTVTKTVAGVDGTYAALADADVTVGSDDELSLSSVSYRVTGTVASNIADYETYYYAFVDELPDALQVDDVGRIEWSVTVKLGAKTADITDAFTCSVSDNVVTWEVADLLEALAAAGFSSSLASVQVVLDYSIEPTAAELAAYCASLSTLADPQTNTVHIVFSNNPYAGGEGSTSETPDDQTELYTYNLVVLKVDETGEALSGAQFTLTDSEGNEVGCDISSDDTTFTFTGLRADTEYTLIESSVPAGYKSIDPIRFVISANLSADGESVESIDVTVNDDPSSATSFTTDDATVKVLVANLPGDDLPLTGLSGNAAGIAGGCALAACGCLIGIALRRMSKAS